MRSKQYVRTRLLLAMLKRVTSDLEKGITSISNRMKVIFMSKCAQLKEITNHKQMMLVHSHRWRKMILIILSERIEIIDKITNAYHFCVIHYAEMQNIQSLKNVSSFLKCLVNVIKESLTNLYFNTLDRASIWWKCALNEEPRQSEEGNR